MALPKIGSDPFLVLNGDSLCRVDLKALFAAHCDWNTDATLLVTQVADTSPYGRVQLHDNGRIIGFEEKGIGQEPGWINAGTYLLHKKLIEAIPTGESVSLEREMFPQWLKKKMHGYPGEGDFLDIGTGETYASAQVFFARGR